MSQISISIFMLPHRHFLYLKYFVSCHLDHQQHVSDFCQQKRKKYLDSDIHVVRFACCIGQFVMLSTCTCQGNDI